MGTPGIFLFGGVALLTFAAPFELTEPLVRLPRQSITSLEAAILVAFAAWGTVIVASRRLPRWQTPLTLPWLALIAAMIVASIASPVSRVNALHMTGRLAAALGVYLLAVNGLTTRSRLATALRLAVAVGVVVSVLTILEYLGTPSVLNALQAFRPGVATVGAQVRAGGPLQYPTIASMFLEIVFALGLGVLLSEHDDPRRRWLRVAVWFVALVIISEAITLTFTRAGLITMATSLVLVGAIRIARRGLDRGVVLVLALAVVIATLFAFSRSRESMWLRFTSEGQESWYRAQIDAPASLQLQRDRTQQIPIALTNTGRLPWDSTATPPILISYHWLPAEGDAFVAFEGDRTPFPSAVAPGDTATIDAVVRAPDRPGDYRLEWDLVQEGRLWFSTEPGAVRVMSRAAVLGDAAVNARGGTLTPPPRPTVRPGRLTLWRAGLKMFAAHPVLGVGPDNFRLAYGAYAGIDGADPRTHSNNMYLEMFAGGGLLVGAAFLWLVWRAAGGFARLAREAAPQDHAIAVGLAAAGLAIALHAAVDSFLSFAPIYVLFSLTLGYAAASARGMEAE
jgi:O-antigen ligase